MTTKRLKRGPGPASARGRKKGLAVSIIGAGRLGLALGVALQGAGVAIDLMVTRSPSSARRAAKLLGSPVVAAGSKQLAKLPGKHLTLLQQTDLILIAAADDFVSQISQQLSAVLSRGGSTRSRRLPAVVHTSGALTSRILSSVQRLGVPVGSIHPLVSISSHQNHQPFSSVYFSLEGDAGAIRLGKQLVRYLGGRSFVIQTRNKPLYHAAALMVSPNLTALIDIAIEMMGRAGIRSSQARRMLLPLIGSSLENLSHQDPARALTGTFKRGDITTAQLHLDAIASERLTDALKAYIILGERSLKLSDISTDKKATIRKLLYQADKLSRRL